MEKQTALKWFLSQMTHKFYISYDVIQKAIDMEKEQIIDAFNQGNINEGNFFDRVNITAEKYYTETYKSE